ncbi:MAG: metallophosphoesterase [Burkholderiaceae bacterium]|nr:metallophosphoesterase [Burkholderiaceae bacterium]
MRKLLHLSDLHFGRIDPALMAPLKARVEQLAPDLVVVSGDLTQRARSRQFQQARIFLDSLPGPRIVVPGNHDVPLFNLLSRFFRPLDKYRRHITDDLTPEYVDEQIAVLGVNTARSLTFKDGRIGHDQIARLRARLASLPPELIKVVVTHHPFDLPPHLESGDLVRRGPLAMAMFADHGVDLLLAGHLHASHAGNTAARHPIAGYAALMVQAGTATSTRGRGETNSFNFLRIEPERVTVERYGWLGAGFELADADSFTRAGGIWSAA